MSCWAIKSDVSSHDAPLAMIFEVVYPSYERTKLVRWETARRKRRAVACVSICAFNSETTKKHTTTKVLYLQSSPPTPEVSTVLNVMICFAFVDPRQVLPPSGKMPKCLQSLHPQSRFETWRRINIDTTPTINRNGLYFFDCSLPFSATIIIELSPDVPLRDESTTSSGIVANLTHTQEMKLSKCIPPTISNGVRNACTVR